MNHINITKLQRANLLQMCRYYWPENFYKEIDGHTYFTDNYNNIVFEQRITEFKHELITIHWFEFCMTHLAVKLANIYTMEELDMYISILKGEHPVDYLWKVYQTNKPISNKRRKSGS